MKFYQCPDCKQILIAADGETPSCCSSTLVEVIPNTVDAAKEKHIPVLSREGQTVTVTVGSVLHPMEEKHFIEWILLCTDQGEERKQLKPGEEPSAQFFVEEDAALTACYAYCNLHGLWAATV